MLRHFAFLLLFTLLLVPKAAPAQTTTTGQTTSHVFIPFHSAASVKDIPVPSAAMQWHRLILRHAAPSNILKWMHWEVTRDGAKNPRLPDGVARIFTLASNNSLVVEATDSGYEKFKQIVTALDIALRQVQIKVLLAALPKSLNLAIDLADPMRALATLQKTNLTAYQLHRLTIDTNASAGFPFEMRLPHLETEMLPADRPQNWSTLTSVPILHFTPYINTDNSVTLFSTFGDDRITSTPRTIASGSLKVYEITNLTQTPGYRVFLFLTPRILPEKSHAGNEEYQTVTVTP